MRNTVSCLVLLSLTSALGSGLALDNAGRKSLTGLHAVAVLVENLRPEVESAGLARATIQTDAELKLRLAGIRVLAIDRHRAEPGAPVLYINANVSMGSDGMWGYSLHVALVQEVQLVRNPAMIVPAETWSTDGAGAYTSSHTIPDSVRSAVKDSIDQFVNAYLEVNPK